MNEFYAVLDFMIGEQHLGLCCCTILWLALVVVNATWTMASVSEYVYDAINNEIGAVTLKRRNRVCCIRCH